MTKEEAVNLLDNICAQISLNRETHIKVQQAIAVLKADNEKPKDPA